MQHVFTCICVLHIVFIFIYTVFIYMYGVLVE